MSQAGNPAHNPDLILFGVAPASAITGPQSENVALPVHGDHDRDVDRPVGGVPW
jgi:hypothetical protein